MGALYDVLKFVHVISFVFMSIPLFNLIVVNERALFSSSFNYYIDRYMENIISHGAYRCFVIQATIFISGILLLMLGPLGINALWTNWIILVKTLILAVLVTSLSYVHFTLQPKIESIIGKVDPQASAPENIMAGLKPYRLRRKRMASFCLFGVLTTIILGIQVYSQFEPLLTVLLIGCAALFSWRSYTVLNRFGWF